ncbi:MAG: AAA family ATPase [Caldilineaceae bacterium SB0661_bin_32]|uniref:AAA family ATPase n=1 Tax=Caldilineaceae bacterium SB0661_bin_32 TaxID=2605255 RepID=A0A6B1D238_9CHLR|nr:AAA family ATPase [Caldilineaceae bacterium SB0661_bin_32]
MITRIELDGFKTFQDFSLDLAPLQVIVGANGAGKSNLFDALQLLSRLADSDLLTAFQDMRGEVGELFTIRTDGGTSDRINLAVEMLVNREVQDDWGTRKELRYARMRYELVIVRRRDELDLDRLYVEHEMLATIPRNRDRWTKSYNLKTESAWIPRITGGRSPFISTDLEMRKPTLTLHQDGRGGRRNIVAEQAERTVLSGIQNTEFPHAFAVAEEMRAWRFLHLNPGVLRQPSPMTATTKMAADGSFLPNALARMSAIDPMLLADVSRDLANRVPGILQIEVEEDRKLERFVIWAKTVDGRRFSSRVLSDGTLRLLALITMTNDPDHEGVLCFEEPENGVHPSRLGSMTHLLRELATDFSEPKQADFPLRQILSNTHSPAFISYTEILPHVLFAHMVTRVNPADNQQPQRVTKISPVIPDPLQPQLPIPAELRSYTLSEVCDYLESANLEEARRELEGKLARANGRPIAESLEG